MGFFQQVEGEACILSSNGVHFQTEMYTWNGYLYAKHGGGYIRLFEDGSTTKAKVRLEHMSWTGDLHRDHLGRLCAEKKGNTKRLDHERENRLLMIGAE